MSILFNSAGEGFELRDGQGFVLGGGGALASSHFIYTDGTSAAVNTAAGPGNTYFRNRVLSNETTDGITYNDVSVLQNLMGNSAVQIWDIDGLATDNIEHGNVINGQTIWSDAIADHTLPNSYYLTSKPDFFEGLQWPLYGPEEGFDSKLPAQNRFE
jgi:hypothetical protein